MLRRLSYDPTDELMATKRSKLGEELAVLQRQMQGTEKSLLIILSGWESTGKGAILNELSRELDPRHFHLTQFEDFIDNQRSTSRMAPYFPYFPMHGDIAIFDHSFYMDLMHNPDISDAEFERAVSNIQFVERLLHDDNCMVLKFFTTQDEKTMRKRINELKEDKTRSFLLSDFDLYQLENFQKFHEHFIRVLDRTSTIHCPWYVIDTTNRKEAASVILSTCVKNMRWHVSREIENDAPSLPPIVSYPVSGLDLTPTITPEDYSAKLKPLQQEARNLLFAMYRLGIPSVVVFEGSDAAGKGGSIKRLTRMMDPRSYNVATTAAPTKHELAHHYLWRFYQTFPQPGHLTIYDRSWYGRVMVERIEGFASKRRWQEAYDEMNEMEESLMENGCMVLKFLLVIDKEEQLKRFEERQNTPEKNYKITEEDWRNREKFDEYVVAMDEMVVRTSTIDRPWIVISSQDKRYARIKVLEEFNAAVKRHFAKLGIDPDDVQMSVDAGAEEGVSKKKSGKKSDKKADKKKLEKSLEKLEEIVEAHAEKTEDTIDDIQDIAEDILVNFIEDPEPEKDEKKQHKKKKDKKKKKKDKKKKNKADKFNANHDFDFDVE